MRFADLWQRLGAVGGAEAVFARLAAAYGEPARAYHTLDHVIDCLDTLEEAAPLPEHDLVEAAIWFHDVVYDPRRSDNEARSAEWAARALNVAGLPPETVSRLQALIRATDHATPLTDPTVGLLCDVDLSILGREEEEFADYERRIRREYSHLPESLYRAGRAKVLAGFLARPWIYQTARFRERFETAARRNLSGALPRLES